MFRRVWYEFMFRRVWYEFMVFCIKANGFDCPPFFRGFRRSSSSSGVVTFRAAGPLAGTI